MALGGGTFISQNKVLPGTYINVVSAARASASLSGRGYAAIALELDWGPDEQMFEITTADIQKESVKLFGYAYTDDKLKGLRDLFQNIRTLYAYRLNSGVKAANTYATARHSGIRGNDLKVVIAANVDKADQFDVATLLDGKTVDVQTVANAKALTANDYVDFKTDATLSATAGAALSGGTNGTVTGENHQAFLDAVESYSFNTLGCLSTEESVKGLYTAFTKRMRDEVGVKFQTVLYRAAADYEGVISVENQAEELGYPESAAVYWVTGISAGCPVNGSNTNKKYTGEITVNAEYKQSQLEAGLQAGKFMLHKVGQDIRVLDDINSFVSASPDKNSDFASNQTVRVLDQIANDIAVLFNTKYLGKIPNDDSGRASLWGDIVAHHKELQQMRAIENFAPESVVVEKGNSKKSVVVADQVTPVNAMAQLYMTITVA